MDDALKDALDKDLVIDITTTGKKTGQPRRKEIWFHNLDGVFYITGSPGPRSWYANMRANPEFTFHLKRSTQVDLRARATSVTDNAQRQEILDQINAKFEGRRNMNTKEWVEGSPLVRVEFLDS